MWRLKRPVHSSWVIAAAGVAIFVGIVWAKILPPGMFATFTWAGCGILLVAFSSVKQKLGVLLFAIIGGLFIGLWRGSNETAQLAKYKSFSNKTVRLDGVVAEDIGESKHHTTTLVIRDVTIDGKQLPGNVWISLEDTAELKRSNHVEVRGELQSGFGSFAGSMYRAKLVEVVQITGSDPAREIRDWFASAVRRVIAEPAASLGIGFLVGQRSNLPDNFDEALRIAGLTHVVVASGYNLTILVRLGRRLFARISKYLATATSSGLIIGFIAITGISPSMSRAGLIAFLSLAAWYYGRKFHPFVLLSTAIAATVLFNPFYAWGDIGWQLSFAAFAGVMVFAPLLQTYFFGDRKPNFMLQIIIETMSAWLVTLPILVLTFGYVSNVAIFANALILPLVPFAMLLVFISGVSVLFLPFIAGIVSVPAAILLQYMVNVTNYLAGLSWAKTEVSISVWFVALFYGLLISFGVYMWRKTRLDLRDRSIID